MQLPGSQSPDIVKQPQTVTILHPTQVLMIFIERHPTRLSTGKVGAMVIYNKLVHTHFTQTHRQSSEGTKTIFLFS